MKIPLKKTKKEAVAPWHQDFRNTESLPDIKVIRTRFFVNVVSVVLPLIVGILWIQNELSLGVLRGDIAELEVTKVSMNTSNQALVALSRDFIMESAKIESLDDYYFNLFPVSDYMVVLSEKVPEEMIISSVELKKGNRINGNEVIDIWESQISGYVAQSSQESITFVNDLVEDIEQEELFTPYLEQAFLENLSRDQASDTLNFTVSITMSDTGKNAGEVTQ
ncbi:MAG: hypothetical protein O7C75_21935 [Verrucomicrobia bacterium]|nr:hypothetical protein [Verrucomicrobiota bacterium]